MPNNRPPVRSSSSQKADLASCLGSHNEVTLDLSNGVNHPLLFRYSEIFDSSILKASFHKGRLLPGISIALHPFVDFLTASAPLMGKSRLNYLKKRLADFYDSFQPVTAEAWFGISLLNPHISKVAPWKAVLPWRARSLDSYAQAVANAAILDNSKNGLNMGIVGGWTFCGPASNEKIDIEATRFLSIYESIRTNGYTRSDDDDGDVRCTALVDQNYNWTWLVTSGIHRACALAALNIDCFKIRVNNVVVKSEVCFWPHVVDGLYTEAEALRIFDKIFEGNTKHG